MPRPWLTLVLPVALLVHAGCDDDAPSGLPDGTIGPGEPGTGAIQKATLLAQDLTSPFDAVPTADASAVYVTAIGNDGGGVLVRLPAAGGAATQVANGFVLPIAMALSTDGNTVYVADLGADEDAQRSGGVVYAVPAQTGAATAIEETWGLEPRAATVARVGGSDVLYVTGTAEATGRPEVFRVAAGVAATPVTTGVDLVDPHGLAVTTSGTVYVLDARAGPGGSAVVIRGDSAAGQPAPVAGGDGRIAVGAPSGLALSPDEKFLLIPGRSGSGAAVLRVELASGTVQTFTTGLAEATEPAGLHRAASRDQYAFVSSGEDGTGGGRVYLLTTAQ